MKNGPLDCQGEMMVVGLDFSYANQPVFTNLSFASASRILGLSGPPGCGKTTLLKILSGRLNATRCVSIQVPRPAILVLQEDGLLPWLTVKQNLELVGLRQDENKVHPLWELVGPLESKLPSQMSFGQRRTVELYRAVAKKAPLLCLDEPFNFIDMATRQMFIEYLANKSIGRVAMSSHHIEELIAIGADTLKFSGRLPVRELSN